MNIEILFENENALVINKPSGLVVHSDGKTTESTVVDWVLEKYPEINGVGENMFIKGKDDIDIELNRPGIVHRIDRDTSGCLVIAKTQKSFQNIKEQFKNREVIKTYYALVYGHIKNSAGIIDVPIGRSSKDFRLKMAGSHARGTLRDAQTEYFVIERYIDEQTKDKQNQFEKYTLVECRPKTGRTHQIRVHLKHLNHPIISDSLYKGKRKQVLGMERTALHAYSIKLNDISGENIFVKAPLAIDIQTSINSLLVVKTEL